jgi:6-phosphogluconolactonase
VFASPNQDICYPGRISPGLGEDGHTASLFPGSESLLIHDKICAPVIHPETGQPRLTFSLPLINQARRITFLVTGISKSGLVAAILRRQLDSQGCPAAAVHPKKGELIWYLDKDAAEDFSGFSPTEEPGKRNERP